MRSIKFMLAGLVALAGLTAAAQKTLPLQPPAPAAAATPSPAPPVAVPDRPVAGVPLTAEDLNVWLDGFVPYALDRGNVAGAVLVVVKDGQVLTKRGFGYADVEKRTPVDPDRTLFRPGSTSKLFTWTAVMQLVEQGKIDLDADVNQYLDFKIPPRDGKPITMRNIMTHTAGFEEQIKWIMSHDREIPHYSDLLKKWIPERIFAPGTTPAYSNYATSLAGYIVERVSGEPYNDYVERHILKPLGMLNTTARQPLPDRLKPMMSNGYKTASDKPDPFELVGPVPAGAFAATGTDMAQFMIAHLQDGALGNARILRPETARMMHTSANTILPGIDRMMLGFMESNLNGRRIIGHGGDTLAFHTMLSLFLDDNVGVYFSMNSAGSGAGNIRGDLMEGFANRYFPKARDTRRGVDAETAAEHARMMTGLWQGSRGSFSTFFGAPSLLGQQEITVSSKGELVTGGGGGRRPKWVEVAPFVWEDMDGNGRIAAEVVDGKVVRYSGSPIGMNSRVAWYKSSGWLLPSLYLSLAIFLLTSLLWPVRALVRRHYGTGLALQRRELFAYRGTAVLAILYLVTIYAWYSIVGSLNLTTLNDSLDARLTITQLLTILVFFGGLAAMLWNLWLVWSGKRKWTARIWSLALLFAAIIMLWIGIAFHLVDLSTNF